MIYQYIEQQHKMLEARPYKYRFSFETSVPFSKQEECLLAICAEYNLEPTMIRDVIVASETPLDVPAIKAIWNRIAQLPGFVRKASYDQFNYQAVKPGYFLEQMESVK